MNYEKHYKLLIKSAQCRVLDSYTESHHIIPRCMGGLDTNSNLVNLTPEEHFVAHQLLVKIYPENRSLRYAANLMGNRNNKKYGWLKRKVSQNMKDSNPMRNPESRKKSSNSQLKKWTNPEYREKQSQAHKGKPPGNSKWLDAPEGTTWCSGHKNYLLVDFFPKNKKTKSGYYSKCKECYAKDRKTYKGR